MDHPKQRSGNHTWDMILHYYRCPKCGYVMENRDKFAKRFDRAVKELECPRCKDRFSIEKRKRQSLGPLLGHEREVDEG